MTGAYEEGALKRLLARVRPDVLWFPAQWPETYSYTLSAGLAAGLPIVASAIGAFPERLAGRPLTWLVDPAAPPGAWLATFAAVRTALADGAALPEVQRAVAGAWPRIPAPAAPTVPAAPPARRSVVVIPERFDDGTLTPCAYIRLLLPLDHPQAGAGLDVTVAPRDAPLGALRADTIVTHRHAIATPEQADALARHCRGNGIRLVYDLDDDLLALPPRHPDAARLAPLAPAVARLLAAADVVSVSTQALAARLRRRRPDAVVLENGLDERLWADPPPARLRRGGVVRILYMGSQTHAEDFALVVPAMERLLAVFGPQIGFDMIGVSAGAVPGWVGRIGPPPTAGSYPGFVNWLLQQGAWDIGIAPLAAGRFNAGKSAIKALEYAALGLPSVASDSPAYRGSAADQAGGILVANTEAAWHEALLRLLRDPDLRARLAAGGRAWLAEHGTLAVQADARRAGWGLGTV